MLAEGKYKARGTELTWVSSPEKGTTGAVVRCEITEGSEKGQTIDWVGWMTERNAERASEALATFGFDGVTDSTISSNQVQITVTHESYTSKDGRDAKSVRVSWVNPVRSATDRFTKLGAGDAELARKGFRALMAGKKKTTTPF